jgi:XTP/dITP diphosphohydrolase
LKLLVATNNRGKLAEIKHLLNLPGLELVTPFEAGLAPDFDVEETGATFEENAVLKATQYARAAQLYALADDSGLEVDALGGQPGVYSKRFAGENATDRERIAYLLSKLPPDLPENRLTARFVASIALADSTGRIIKIEEGLCEGHLTRHPRGSNGFGYDPIFVLNGPGRTLAELSASEKDLFSHRGNALTKIRPFLQQFLLASGSELP